MEMLNVVLVVQAVIIALLSGINVSMRIQKEREVGQLEVVKERIRRLHLRILELEAVFVGSLTSEKLLEEINKDIDDYINEDIKATHEFYVQNEEDIAARYFETVRRK